MNDKKLKIDVKGYTMMKHALFFRSAALHGSQSDCFNYELSGVNFGPFTGYSPINYFHVSMGALLLLWLLY